MVSVETLMHSLRGVGEDKGQRTPRCVTSEVALGSTSKFRTIGKSDNISLGYTAQATQIPTECQPAARGQAVVVVILCDHDGNVQSEARRDAAIGPVG